MCFRFTCVGLVGGVDGVQHVGVCCLGMQMVWGRRMGYEVELCVGVWYGSRFFRVTFWPRDQSLEAHLLTRGVMIVSNS